MKDLLFECSKNTGCDEDLVEKVVSCFLNIIANRLSKGRAVDLGDSFGAFIIRERTGNVENSPHTHKTDRYKVCFREGKILKHRLKSQLTNTRVSSIGLLELLQYLVGCMYLSDLPDSSNLLMIQSALKKIDPNNYSLREWNDAVHYITRQDLHFSRQNDAARYLINYTQTEKLYN